jgi:hypothetical protein
LKSVQVRKIGTFDVMFFKIRDWTALDWDDISTFYGHDNMVRIPSKQHFSAGRHGISAEQIIAAFKTKLAKNKARQWARNADNTYSHVKE